MSVLERFLRYVKIDTRSDEASGSVPSTAGQHELARLLAGELGQMGAKEIVYDREHCYVYATVPASPGCQDAPVLGLIAHMDTSPAMSGAGVKPRLITGYDGRDIVLNEKEGIVLRVQDFPEIADCRGRDLVVTDGTTLLGADDKAGVAEIMTAAEYLLAHPEIRHGRIRIGFTPDEEIGRGTDHFDVKLFGADCAYTVDGGAPGELEYENFNAAGARLLIRGCSVHPGAAKGRMKNALLIAMEFQSLLPVSENPMYTQGREGFYHLDALGGSVEQAQADYIIRDHDRQKFEEKKKLFLEAARFLNAKYGEGTVTVSLRDSYYNMRQAIEPHMYMIDLVKEAMGELGLAPCEVPIRGGTDGARLSFMGLPCPNLGTGGGACHGKFEYACVQSMETVTKLLIRLAEKYGERKRGANE